jgi:hypothetical protein
MIASAWLRLFNRTARVWTPSPVPTSAALLPRNERAPEMSNMMRDSQIMAQTNDENLGYMSDMALELAQMAEDSGLATLAYLFRMAALEASTANSVLAEPDDLPRQMTSH